MSRIFWDTSLFIYFLEDYGPFSLMTKELRQKMVARGDQLLTSTLTLGEVLVKPTERGDRIRCNQYERVISETAVVLPFDRAAARKFASVRCDHAIKPPDAIQLACAATAGVDLFFTNDDQLPNKRIPGIQFIVPLTRNPI
jgi:predicted nucleic acid-binding protein